MESQKHSEPNTMYHDAKDLHSHVPGQRRQSQRPTYGPRSRGSNGSQPGSTKSSFGSRRAPAPHTSQPLPFPAAVGGAGLPEDGVEEFESLPYKDQHHTYERLSAIGHQFPFKTSALARFQRSLFSEAESEFLNTMQELADVWIGQMQTAECMVPLSAEEKVAIGTGQFASAHVGGSFHKKSGGGSNPTGGGRKKREEGGLHDPSRRHDGASGKAFFDPIDKREKDDGDMNVGSENMASNQVAMQAEIGAQTARSMPFDRHLPSLIFADDDDGVNDRHNGSGVKNKSVPHHPQGQQKEALKGKVDPFAKSHGYPPNWSEEEEEVAWATTTISNDDFGIEEFATDQGLGADPSDPSYLPKGSNLIGTFDENGNFILNPSKPKPNASILGTPLHPSAKNLSLVREQSEDIQLPNQRTPLIGQQVLLPPITAETRWLYRDPAGIVQGPFSNQKMLDWYNRQYFPESLPLCREHDAAFETLLQWKLKYQGIAPFALPSLPQSSPTLPVGTIGQEKSISKQVKLPIEKVQPQQPEKANKSTSAMPSILQSLFGMSLGGGNASKASASLESPSQQFNSSTPFPIGPTSPQLLSPSFPSHAPLSKASNLEMAGKKDGGANCPIQKGPSTFPAKTSLFPTSTTLAKEQHDFLQQFVSNPNQSKMDSKFGKMESFNGDAIGFAAEPVWSTKSKVAAVPINLLDEEKDAFEGTKERFGGRFKKGSKDFFTQLTERNEHGEAGTLLSNTKEMAKGWNKPVVMAKSLVEIQREEELAREQQIKREQALAAGSNPKSFAALVGATVPAGSSTNKVGVVMNEPKHIIPTLEYMRPNAMMTSSKGIGGNSIGTTGEMGAKVVEAAKIVATSKVLPASAANHVQMNLNTRSIDEQAALCTFISQSLRPFNGPTLDVGTCVSLLMDLDTAEGIAQFVYDNLVPLIGRNPTAQLDLTEFTQSIIKKRFGPTADGKREVASLLAQISAITKTSSGSGMKQLASNGGCSRDSKSASKIGKGFDRVDEGADNNDDEEEWGTVVSHGRRKHRK